MVSREVYKPTTKHQFQRKTSRPITSSSVNNDLTVDTYELLITNGYWEPLEITGIVNILVVPEPISRNW